jgi:hypothetical protein
MSDPHYAWSSTVDDGKYFCCVEQDQDGYNGILIVTETATGTVILRATVGIAYAARFGPDVSDVERWQDMCIEAIDARG